MPENGLNGTASLEQPDSLQNGNHHVYEQEMRGGDDEQQPEVSEDKPSKRPSTSSRSRTNSSRPETGYGRGRSGGDSRKGSTDGAFKKTLCRVQTKNSPFQKMSSGKEIQKSIRLHQLLKDQGVL